MSTQAIPAAPAPGLRLPGLGLLGDERLARMVAGDQGEAAFAVLYQRYHQPLYRYCRSMLRHDSDAQDALQTAFAAALVALRKSQRDSPVRPWLFRIVHNEAINVMRRRHPDAALFEDGVGSTISLQEHAEHRERLALLLRDMAQLPERQRQTLVLKELNGLTHAEIAAVLGVSAAVAKQTLLEARRSLLQCEEGRASGCADICHEISDAPRYATRRRRVRAHLQACPDCATFAAAIETRRADLHALAPALPALGAAGVLARLCGGAAGPGGTGGATGVGTGGGGAASAVAGNTAGLIVSVKTVAVIAVIATTAGGVVTELRSSAHPLPPAMGAGSPAGRSPQRGQLVGAGALTTSGPATSQEGTGSPQLRHDRRAASVLSRDAGRSGTAAARSATSRSRASARTGSASGAVRGSTGRRSSTETPVNQITGTRGAGTMPARRPQPGGARASVSAGVSGSRPGATRPAPSTPASTAGAGTVRPAPPAAAPVPVASAPTPSVTSTASSTTPVATAPTSTNPPPDGTTTATATVNSASGGASTPQTLNPHP